MHLNLSEKKFVDVRSVSLQAVHIIDSQCKIRLPAPPVSGHMVSACSYRSASGETTT